ncbi:MAG: T9SS C-terminal target domain-containing protein [Bacteroidetes bacterium]|nr:MAG: T9SS C-terminal target domain-containing protein [Bacteroidota bacterium]TAG87352.1 MAG: T9SS C-terminal target domain-containing protein [Bacteroidota bacterium]
MKKQLILSIFFFLFQSIFIFGQSFNWLRTPVDSGNNDNIVAFSVDNAGNTYVIGNYGNSSNPTDMQTLTLQSSPSQSVTTTSQKLDIFIAKYSPTGTVLWVKTIGNAENDQAVDIAVTNDGTTVFVLGMFTNNLTLPITPNPITLSNTSNTDAFIYKMNGATGDGIGVQQINATNDLNPKAMAYNNVNEKITVVGYTIGAASALLPSPNNFIGTAGGSFDIFVAGFDAIDLSLKNSLIIGGASTDIAWGVDIDATGIVYVGGNFNGTVNFGAGQTRTSAGANGDGFVAKISPVSVTYSLNWVKHFKSGAGAIGGRTSAVRYELTNDKVYATGFFTGTTDFDDGIPILNLTSIGSDDVFVTTFSATTGAVDRATGFGSDGIDSGSTIDADSQGNIYVGGYVGSGATSMNIGAGFDKTFTLQGEYDGFVGVLNGTGNWAWATTFGGTGSEFCSTIKKTTDKIIYAGSFQNIVNFNPSGTSNATAFGTDLFLMNLNVEKLIVYNKNNTGFASLRQAILNSNQSPNATNITFQIPNNTTQLINITGSNLPTITQSTTIDGLTQAGATATNPTIKIDGTALTGGGIGIDINATGCTIRGLNISKFSTVGIKIESTASNTTIENCFIGTDITGNSAEGNGIGILAEGSSVYVGGTGKGNLISGNSLDGIRFLDVSPGSIEENIIGLNQARSAALPNATIPTGANFGISLNSSNGVNIFNNTICGHNDPNDGAINLSNNSGVTSPNYVIANKIGNNGTSVFANNYGVLVNGSTNNVIGDNTLSVPKNIIGGNQTGIMLTGSSNNNKIISNYIGTNNNNANFSNGTAININTTSRNNKIGGILINEANTIAYGSQSLVIDNSVQNKIQRNSFYCNSAAISLTNGGNNGKNPPIITNASALSVQGTCAVGDTIEVYSVDNTNCVTNTIAQGTTYLGNAIVTGTTWNFAGSFTNGTIITATATNTNNTSPFSNTFTIVSNPNQFSATTLSVSSIQLNWASVSGNVLGYQIERCDNNIFAVGSITNLSVNVIPVSTNTWTDTGLQNNKEYFYRIRTVISGSVTSAWSPIVSATTGNVSAPPTNLLVVTIANSFTSTKLTWTDNSNNELGFEIERASVFTNNVFQRIHITNENITEYIDNEDVLANVRYVYRVRAINSIINSPYTNQFPITLARNPNETTPTLPINLVVTSVSSEQIDLFWSYNVTPEIYFVIERSTSLTGTFSVLDTIVNSSQITKYYGDIKNLTANQQYCYRLRAFGIGGNSPYSQVQCATAICGLTDLVVTRDDASSNPPICSGKSAALRLNKRPFKALYQWKKNNIAIDGAVFPIYLAEETGLYSCTVTIEGTTCVGTTLAPITIIVQGTPTPASITYTSNCLRSSVLDANPNSYQWYKNYVPISGANQNQYCTNQPGIYYVTFTVINCASTSSAFILGDVNALETDISQNLKVFPNPAQDELNLELETILQGKYQWTIKDIHGKIVLETQGEKTDFILQQKININHLPNGIYIVEWKNERGQARKKIIKRN